MCSVIRSAPQLLTFAVCELLSCHFSNASSGIWNHLSHETAHLHAPWNVCLFQTCSFAGFLLSLRLLCGGGSWWRGAGHWSVSQSPDHPNVRFTPPRFREPWLLASSECTVVLMVVFHLPVVMPLKWSGGDYLSA